LLGLYCRLSDDGKRQFLRAIDAFRMVTPAPTSSAQPRFDLVRTRLKGQSNRRLGAWKNGSGDLRSDA
jgi:hypothetical protein